MAVVAAYYNDMTDRLVWYLWRRPWGRVVLRERLWLWTWARYLWAGPECLVDELIRHRAWTALEALAGEDT